MSSEIKVPTLPESIADALIVTWHKKPGDPVKRDEVLVDVETDKVVLEVPAAEDGVLGEIIEEEGATVEAHQVIGTIEAAGSESGSGDDDGESDDAEAKKGAGKKGDAGKGGKSAKSDGDEEGGEEEDDDADGERSGPGQTSPSVRKLLAEHDLSAEDVRGTGKNGRISKEDVERHVADGGESGYGGTEERPAAKGGKSGKASSGGASADSGGSSDGKSTGKAASKAGGESAEADADAGPRTERRVPMTRLRARIAERLLSATQNTAMLTTFNEVDMSGFIALRSKYKDLCSRRATA